MRYLINFSYDGSAFNGYQRQKIEKTVQKTIEDALTTINEKKVNIHASGRTDKGVHAINQYAHFDLDKKINPYNIKKHINTESKGEIFVKNVSTIPNDFHARYNVKSKVYSYYINTGEYNPIKRNYEYQYNKELNIKDMKKASKYLIGIHDFRSFCTDEKTKENCIREIYYIKISKKKNQIIITFKGNGFLRKMIRNIVSILIEIGNGQKKPIYMKEILKQEKRLGNLKTAPSEGLYLEKINFKD